MVDVDKTKEENIQESVNNKRIKNLNKIQCVSKNKKNI